MSSPHSSPSAGKLRNIGHAWLSFWVACMREREAGMGVYAEWTTLAEQHYRSEHKALSEASRSKASRPAAVADMPAEFYRFATTDCFLRQVRMESPSLYQMFVGTFWTPVPLGRMDLFRKTMDLLADMRLDYKSAQVVAKRQCKAAVARLEIELGAIALGVEAPCLKAVASSPPLEVYRESRQVPLYLPTSVVKELEECAQSRGFENMKAYIEHSLTVLGNELRQKRIERNVAARERAG